MISEYGEGRTPNPDVMCNKEIKFGHFLKFALENGADFVATGHYARTSSLEPHRKTSLKKSSGLLSPLDQTFLENFSVRLLEGSDKNKDQSYFLWTLTQDQLKCIIFPVGDLKKEEVRKFALKFGLPQADRKDSQGLCFLGQIDMKEFLKEYLETKKGDVLSEKGEVIGEHDGAALYTLGERRGFRVFNEKTDSKPLYIVDKDVVENTVTVAARKSSSSESPRVSSSAKADSARLSSEDFSSRRLNSQNWILGETPKGEIECRVRYRGEKIPCKVIKNEVVFRKPELISPGQSVIFYDGDICLGGGIVS